MLFKFWLLFEIISELEGDFLREKDSIVNKSTCKASRIHGVVSFRRSRIDLGAEKWCWLC